MHAHCPTCGHHVSEELTFDEGAANVSYKGQTVHLSPAKIEILQALAKVGKRGMKKMDLWLNLYELRPDCDVPDYKIIDVHICQMRNILSRHQFPLDLDTTWGGHVTLVFDRVPGKSGTRKMTPSEARV